MAADTTWRAVTLQALKSTLGFPLIRFEDAIINMYPFTRVHPYETQEIIINDILKHFREVEKKNKRFQCDVYSIKSRNIKVTPGFHKWRCSFPLLLWVLTVLKVPLWAV